LKLPDLVLKAEDHVTVVDVYLASSVIVFYRFKDGWHTLGKSRAV
jgi:hypothetical protein